MLVARERPRLMGVRPRPWRTSAASPGRHWLVSSASSCSLRSSRKTVREAAGAPCGRQLRARAAYGRPRRARTRSTAQTARLRPAGRLRSGRCGSLRSARGPPAPPAASVDSSASSSPARRWGVPEGDGRKTDHARRPAGRFPRKRGLVCLSPQGELRDRSPGGHSGPRLGTPTEGAAPRLGARAEHATRRRRGSVRSFVTSSAVEVCVADHDSSFLLAAIRAFRPRPGRDQPLPPRRPPRQHEPVDLHLALRRPQVTVLRSPPSSECSRR